MPEGECACPANTNWNGRECVSGGRGTTSPPPPPPPIIDCPRGTKLVNGVCQKPKCPDGMFGDWPKCCPNGARFDGARCILNKGTGDGGASDISQGPDKTDPVDCPRGTKLVRGVCRKIQCPDGMFGDWPHCCPIGARFDGARCILNKGPGTGGSTDLNQKHDTTPQPCPRGTRRIGGVCRKPECPRGMFGDWPKCCPNGTHFDGARCVVNKDPGTGGATKVDPGEDKRPKCPVGTIGRYPRCRCPLGMTGTPPQCCPAGTRYRDGKCIRPKPTVKCPAGTHLTRSGQCERDVSPTPKPTPTPTPTTKPTPTGQCHGGRMGTPPNCFCRPGTRFIGGRCRPFRPKPAPNKNDDKVIVR